MVENKEFPVKYCTGCKNVYETDKHGVEYYPDFPTYGLERETCCNCEDK